MREKTILHHAEELGQARAYTTEEAQAIFRLAIIIGLWVGTSALLLGLGYWMYDRWDLWTAFYILSLPLGVLVGGGLVLAKGVHEQLDGLRSWREATTYAPAPPMPQQAAMPSTPIVVKPYQGTPYVLNRQEPLALPDGRQAGLSLNPPTVAAILREVVTHHDGLWSRDRLMGIRINGQRITRSLYEQMTHALANAGFLQERPTGGFQLPQDVHEFEDLVRYFPMLEGRKAGGKEGRQEQGGAEGGNPSSGEVETLAERRRQKWLALGCDVTAYLEWRRSHGS